MMQKFIIMLALILGCVSVNAAELRVNDDPGIVPLKPKINPGFPEDSIPLDPPVGRSPMNVPIVLATLNGQYISIDATVFDPEWITVTIYDEDDNIVLSGAYSSSTVFGINLSSLPSGNYTIKLEIDGYSYYYEGEFEI